MGVFADHLEYRLRFGSRGRNDRPLVADFPGRLDDTGGYAGRSGAGDDEIRFVAES